MQAAENRRRFDAETDRKLVPVDVVNEVIEIGAREAQRPFFFHEKEIAFPRCLTALDTL